MSKKLLVCLVTMALLVLAGLAFAQPPQGGGQGGMGGMRGNFDPAQMMQRRLDMMKEELGATDQEWTAISPRLQKVMEMSTSLNGMGMRGMFGMRGMRGGRGGMPGMPGMDENNPVTKASTELQTAVESGSADDIKAKLTAYRSALEKAKSDLATAQADLKKILSIKQEASLVLMGQLP